MLSFWLPADPAGRRRVVMIGLTMLLLALVINQLAQHMMPVKRASPSISFTDTYRVSDLLNFPTKDASKDSFPGDHGMMLLIFASVMLRYFGKKSIRHRDPYICHICFPPGNDWRALVYGYCRRFTLCGVDWPALVSDDATER